MRGRRHSGRSARRGAEGRALGEAARHPLGLEVETQDMAGPSFPHMGGARGRWHVTTFAWLGGEDTDMPDSGKKGRGG
eukprot:scaffold54096_cov33-Tisochrysis_lutea.AAC.2